MTKEKENKKMIKLEETKKMIKVIISSSDNEFDKEFLFLTDDQLRLLRWLEEEDFLPYGTMIETIETTVFKEI